MPPPQFLGPHTAALEAFVSALPAVPWFTSVETPLAGSGFRRTDLHLLATHHSDPWVLWGSSLAAAEHAITAAVFEQRLLAEQQRLQQLILVAGPTVDDFLASLDDRWDGYFPDTRLYPHEIPPEPERLVRGAAYELLVGFRSGFFTDMFSWFRRGFFPVGWDGSWPNGTLLLW